MDKITITDVAAAAGVSPATVSQVFNGARPVSRLTRNRVMEAASQLGYRPNRLAKGLRTKRSELVAVLVQDLGNPFYAALAQGLQESLSPEGYHLVVCNAGGEPGAERALIDDMLSRQVDGLVVASFDASHEDCELAVRRGVPVVVTGKRPAGGYDQVRADEYAAAFAMTGFLLGQGYKDIVHVAGPPGHGPADERADGYRDAMTGAAGCPEVISTEFTITGGTKAFGELQDARRLPRAVFCANDLIAIGFMKAAQEAGLGVPADIAIAGVDDIEAASLVAPALTTVRNPAAEYGRNAGRLLLERLQGLRGEPEDHVIQLEITRRDSA